MNLQGVELTWLGHAAVRLRLEDGTVLLIDPWLDGNPACPEAEYTQERVDAVYVTHGHFDHVGDTLLLAAAHSPQIFAIHEISVYLTELGADNVIGSNKGGTVTGPGGVEATLVDAVHSSGVSSGEGIVPGGEAAGWVLAVPDGPTIYHTGDTTVFGDMTSSVSCGRPIWRCSPSAGITPWARHTPLMPPDCSGCRRSCQSTTERSRSSTGHRQN